MPDRDKMINDCCPSERSEESAKNGWLYKPGKSLVPREDSTLEQYARFCVFIF